MAKFVAIYRIPVESAKKWRETTSKEEMQKQGKTIGEKMMSWTEKFKPSFIGQGIPLGKNTRVSKDSAHEETNDMNYMQVIEADSKDAVLKMFKENPHLEIPTSFIDIMEVPHMGM